MRVANRRVCFIREQRCSRRPICNRIVGKKVTSQFDDLLTSLFGSKKKEDKKKDEKKKGEESKSEKKKKDEGAKPEPDAPPIPPEVQTPVPASAAASEPRPE